MKKITDASYADELAKNSAVVIYIHADWCMPCRKVGPILEVLSTKYAGQVEFFDLNCDENQEVPGQLRVLAIPTVVLMLNKREVDRLIGVHSESEITKRIDKVIEGMKNV